MRFRFSALLALLQLEAIATVSAAGVANISQELGPLLSRDAVITVPSSSVWNDLLIRASTPRISPGYAAVVEVASEGDVQQTIKYANHHDVPFLAVSGTHGWPASLNKVHGGIQINMRRLNSTTLDAGGKTATFGGGVMQYELTQALFKQGKQAVTGICECVSTIGPLLGGGHSMLQGSHGFAADNLVSARVVLANGTAVTASNSENPDLFWALRGAGHNFGIVASFQLNVFDVQPAWNMIALSYTQDKLESFFDTWNKIEDANPNPGLVVLNGVINRNAAVDKANPALNIQILYEKGNSAADAYADAFRAVGPAANSTTNDIAWGDLFDVGDFGLDSTVCRKNQNIAGFPNSFDRWDPAAMRAGFAIFKELTDKPLFNTSAWLLESYGREGVRAVDPSSNAVAPEERSRHILTSPMLWWVGTNAADRDTAVSYGQKIRAAVRKSSGATPGHSYLNYAFGGEELSEMYGRDDGRVARLQSLKKAWDPQNRFGFYNPLA